MDLHEAANRYQMALVEQNAAREEVRAMQGLVAKAVERAKRAEEAVGTGLSVLENAARGSVPRSAAALNVGSSSR